MLKPAQQIIADDMLNIAEMLIDKSSPIEVLEYLGQKAEFLKPSEIDSLPPNIKVKFKNVAAGFKVANLLSESLRSKTAGGLWIKPKQLEQLLTNHKALYLYLGLLWQKADSITFSNGTTMRSVLKKAADELGVLEKIKKQVSTFVEYGHDIKISLDLSLIHI